MGVPTTFVRFFACNLRCTWCFVPETPVLMADWTWRPLGELEVGDAVLGLEQATTAGKHNRLVKTTVERISMRSAPTVLVNGEVRCTADHKFWLTGKNGAKQSAVHSGWREVERAIGLRALFVTAPTEPNDISDQRDYELGYMAGMADGDGTFWTLRKQHHQYQRFRLALNEPALLERFQSYAARAGFTLRDGVHNHNGYTGQNTLPCLWLTKDAESIMFRTLLAKDGETNAWFWGYLGGILDAEGSLSGTQMRVSQYEINKTTRDRIRRVLETLKLSYTEETNGFYLKGGNGQRWHILTYAHPSKLAIRNATYGRVPHCSRVIETVEPTGLSERVVTLTTSVGSFVAGGYVVKNCDTKYSWSRREGGTWEDVALPDLVEQIDAQNARHVVLTGGEPMLQRELPTLAQTLRERGHHLTVETNSTIFRPEMIEHINLWSLSPKLQGAGTGALRLAPLRQFMALPASDQQWKFVITGEADLAQLHAFLSEHPPFAERQLPVIWQPEGRWAEKDYAHALEWLADHAQRPEWREFNVRVLPQMHVLIWGQKRLV